MEQPMTITDEEGNPLTRDQYIEFMISTGIPEGTARFRTAIIFGDIEGDMIEVDPPPNSKEINDE